MIGGIGLLIPVVTQLVALGLSVIMVGAIGMTLMNDPILAAAPPFVILIFLLFIAKKS